ncbi:MAG: NAD(P)-dependent oxidoreductase [Chloroflexi bacterium]|nr:NAD(P)-dependent oxidoreductase [Chloroflexota bacterium]MYD47693.1 NAD(P)-dependent oxidoreductase [Chloroflexota bacterium]
MNIGTVAILSPGDMGHAVGRRLREHELDVVTCLVGRSERTRTLAEQAGIRDVATMEELVEQSDLVMSMTVSAAVPSLCRQVADAIAATGADTLFAECNAIAPQLARELEPVITDAGGRYVDASIIGGPPRPGYSPHFYASGPNAAEFAQLNDFGLTVLKLDGEVGQASGIKMCYAAMTKGSWALYSQLLMAAELMGLTEPLLAEFQSGQESVLQRMERSLPTVPPRARRWVSEMEEIRDTFAHLGMTPHLFEGVADMYGFIGDTPLGEETPESRDRDRSFAETIRQLAEQIEPPAEGRAR